MTGGHRWRGYTHEELYEQLHAGPGPSASHISTERWNRMSSTLAEITAELQAGVASAGATWEGAAADAATAGITPLARWAEDAQAGANVMRTSTELQADFVSKARADMPPPVAVTAEQPGSLTSMVTHLFGGQTDYERQEAARNAAEERAFEVMQTYESSTTSNVATLGQFQPPPEVVVKSAPTPAPSTESAPLPGPVLHVPSPLDRQSSAGNRRGGLGTSGPDRAVAPGVKHPAASVRSARPGPTGPGGPARPTGQPTGQPGGQPSQPSGASQGGTGGSTAPSLSEPAESASGRGGAGSPQQQVNIPSQGRGPFSGILSRLAGEPLPTPAHAPAPPAPADAANPRPEPAPAPAPEPATAPAPAPPAAPVSDATATSSAAPSIPTQVSAVVVHHTDRVGPDSGNQYSASTFGPQAGNQRRPHGTGPGAGRDPFGLFGARGRYREEEDAEHVGLDFLVETEDVFGGGDRVSSPVIGGSL